MQKMLFSFEGRVNRAKWWGYSIAIGLVYAVICGIAMGVFGTNADGSPSMIAAIIMLIGFIAYIWSALAIAVKRWHDRNKSGWWVLISLVPVVGGLWYLIECGFLAGTPGPNNYGADPLGTV